VFDAKRMLFEPLGAGSYACGCAADSARLTHPLRELAHKNQRVGTGLFPTSCRTSLRVIMGCTQEKSN